MFSVWLYFLLVSPYTSTLFVIKLALFIPSVSTHPLPDCHRLLRVYVRSSIKFCVFADLVLDSAWITDFGFCAFSLNGLVCFSDRLPVYEKLYFELNFWSQLFPSASESQFSTGVSQKEQEEEEQGRITGWGRGALAQADI